MKDFLNAVTSGTGGASITGAVTGQTTIAIVSLVLMAAFGMWGAYLRWRDSKALRDALECGDIKKAIETRGK